MPVRSALLLLFVIVFGCAPKPSALETVSKFQRLKNAGDLDGAMGLFAQDAKLNLGPLGEVDGREAIRRLLDYDVSLHAQLEFENCAQEEITVTCRVIEKNDWLRIAGIESITYTENRFILSPEGMIEEVEATLAPESAQRLGQAMAEVDRWARANEPEAYGSLFDADGAFVYSGENGKQILELLAQWRESATD